MLENMLKQYIETALWSSYDEREEDGGELLDKNFSINDFSKSELDKARRDLSLFLDKVPNNIKNTKDFAHDFWLHRNHLSSHLCKREDGQIYELAKSFGRIEIYVGDDKNLYFNR